MNGGTEGGLRGGGGSGGGRGEQGQKRRGFGMKDKKSFGKRIVKK